MSLGSTLTGTLAPAPAAPSLTIAQIAQNEAFDILRIALQVTGLTKTFNRDGDFTVFAPSDDAFRALATDTLGLDIDGLSDKQVAEALVGALGTDLVAEVLTYHVRAGAASLSDLQAEGTVSTLFGADVTVSNDQIIDADPDVENAEFLRGLTDIAATNGVIHAIDQVLLPIDLAESSQKPTIADVAISDSRFEVLTAALVATGLVDAVADRDADLTVFAPTDTAFRQLATTLGINQNGLDAAGLAQALVDALGAETVTNVLLYHVSPESLTAAELSQDGIVETALDNGRLVFDGGQILDAAPQTDASVIPVLVDVETANGVIHALDTVLLPFDLAPIDTNTAGTAGDDRVHLGGGNDRYDADAGNDLVVDGAGDDSVIGGQGQDILSDGAGNDRYFGGANADVFDFTAVQGNNSVRDFSEADVLVFSRDDFASAQDLLDATIVTDNGLKILFEDASVLLRDVATLSEDDFALF